MNKPSDRRFEVDNHFTRQYNPEDSSEHDTMSLNCGHQQDYCSSPRWYMSIENQSGMIMTAEYFWFVHKRPLAIIIEESSSNKAGGIGRENNECCLTKNLFHISKGFLTFRKILRHGAHCEILSPWKICLHLPGLNSRNLGPMTSTLTTRQQRTTFSNTAHVWF
jgi:hypothetical protein